MKWCNMHTTSLQSDLQNRHVSKQQKKRPGLHNPNSLREEVKPKLASLGLDGPVLPTRGKKLKQVIGRVRRVNRHFTRSVTQPSVIKRCNRSKIATGYTGGCLTIRSRQALLHETVTPNQIETPKQRMLSITEW